MAAVTIETGWPDMALSPNGRPNRFDKARAIRTAKNDAYLATCAALKPGQRFAPGTRFKFTIRAQPAVVRERDDDNLVASCKAARDGVAIRLGVRDSQFQLQPVEWLDPKKPGRLIFIIEEA